MTVDVAGDDNARRGVVSLADLLAAAGVSDLAEVLIIRHTFGNSAEPTNALSDPTVVRAYTREQKLKPGAIGVVPARNWLVFTADGGQRSRLYATYDNRGEVIAEQTEIHRFFDLQKSDLLEQLCGRLVVDWGADTINWAKPGRAASQIRVVEIAGPQLVPFPGFDQMLIDFDTLRAVTSDSRYAKWRTALAAVQGIYLIADSTGPGRLYVGLAAGKEGLLGRWQQYARDGHGGNVALVDGERFRPQNAWFSVLRVFGPATPVAELAVAEDHFKRALLTRLHAGLNEN